VARCTICHTLIAPEDPVAECPTCRQQYHQGCWDELGGCATYGCQEAAPAEKPQPAAVVGAGWGDWKTCPHCRREIGASLVVCPCGARFPNADPMTGPEYRAWLERERWVRGRKLTILLLFIASLLGIPAPATGAVAGGLAHQAREELAGSDGTYVAIGYGAAALGAVNLLLMLLLAAGA
jgi:hypothetical protein